MCNARSDCLTLLHRRACKVCNNIRRVGGANVLLAHAFGLSQKSPTWRLLGSNRMFFYDIRPLNALKMSHCWYNYWLRTRKMKWITYVGIFWRVAGIKLFEQSGSKSESARRDPYTKCDMTLFASYSFRVVVWVFVFAWYHSDDK